MDNKLEQEVSDILTQINEFERIISVRRKYIDKASEKVDGARKMIDDLKDHLRYLMRDAQEVSIKIEDFADVSLVKGRESVIITDATKVPEKYKSYETVTKVSKADLKKVLSKGIAVEGAELQRGEGTVKINFK